MCSKIVNNIINPTFKKLSARLLLSPSNDVIHILRSQYPEYPSAILIVSVP